MARRKGMMVGKGKKGYHNVVPKDKVVHSQSARGIKQPQRISPKISNLDRLASRPNVHVTKLEKSGELTNEQARALRSLIWVYHKDQKIWSVGHGETKFVMDALDLSRKKADELIMKVLNELDRENELDRDEAQRQEDIAMNQMENIHNEFGDNPDFMPEDRQS